MVPQHQEHKHDRQPIAISNTCFITFQPYGIFIDRTCYICRQNFVQPRRQLYVSWCTAKHVDFDAPLFLGAWCRVRTRKMHVKPCGMCVRVCAQARHTNMTMHLNIGRQHRFDPVATRWCIEMHTLRNHVYTQFWSGNTTWKSPCLYFWLKKTVAEVLSNVGRQHPDRKHDDQSRKWSTVQITLQKLPQTNTEWCLCSQTYGFNRHGWCAVRGKATHPFVFGKPYAKHTPKEIWIKGGGTHAHAWKGARDTRNTNATIRWVGQPFETAAPQHVVDETCKD